MLNQRLGAARSVTTALLDTEDKIDAALAASSQLTVRMIAGRGSARLSALYGQDALEEVSAAQAELVQARRRIVEAHRKLSVVRDEIGLAHFAVGDEAPKPPMPNIQGRTANDAVAA